MVNGWFWNEAAPSEVLSSLLEGMENSRAAGLSFNGPDHVVSRSPGDGDPTSPQNSPCEPHQSTPRGRAAPCHHKHVVWGSGPVVPKIAVIESHESHREYTRQQLQESWRLGKTNQQEMHSIAFAEMWFWFTEVVQEITYKPDLMTHKTQSQTV